MDTVSKKEAHYTLSSYETRGPVHFPAPIPGSGGGRPIQARGVGCRLLTAPYDPTMPAIPGTDTTSPLLHLTMHCLDKDHNEMNEDIYFEIPTTDRPGSAATGMGQITTMWQLGDWAILNAYSKALEIGAIQPGGLDTPGLVKFTGWTDPGVLAEWEMKLRIRGPGKWGSILDPRFATRFNSMIDCTGVESSKWTSEVTVRDEIGPGVDGQEGAVYSITRCHCTMINMAGFELPGCTFKLSDSTKGVGAEGVLWPLNLPLHLMHDVLPIVPVETHYTELPVASQDSRQRQSRLSLVSIINLTSKAPVRPPWPQIVETPGAFSSPPIYLDYYPNTVAWHRLATNQSLSIDQVAFTLKHELPDGRLIDATLAAGGQANLKIAFF